MTTSFLKELLQAPEPQREALIRAIDRWPDAKEPMPMFGGDGAIILDTGANLFLAIEPDGCTHS